MNNAVTGVMEGKTVVLGISGALAAYKTPYIVTGLKRLGADVRVCMTEPAKSLVAPLTLQTLSNNPVASDPFEPVRIFEKDHVSLAKVAHVLVIAPATANIIGKIANGIADDLLTTTVISTKAPVVIAPAMNANMYQNPLYRRNAQKLADLGYHFVEPVGPNEGTGEMEEPERIVQEVVRIACSQD